MKRGRWACSEAAVRRWRSLIGGLSAAAAAVLLGSSPAVLAATDGQREAVPAQVQVIASDSPTPPAATDPGWQVRPLAHGVAGPGAWMRVRFDVRDPEQPTLLYLPYFYGGGRVLLNGASAADVPHDTEDLRIRWERPMLLPLPAAALKPADNELLIHVYAMAQASWTATPPVLVGSQGLLQPVYERRFFLVRTLPILTWVSGSVVGLLVLFVWLRRRDEVLYGLFGLASLLWAQRTSTFVLESLPPGAWDAWRAVYHLCTGGFVVVMALYTVQLAGWSRRWLTQALIAYGALGPLLYVAFGEGVAARLWTAGLLPVGAGMLVAAVAAAWHQRSGETLATAAAVVLSVIAGVHDQFLATGSPLLARWLPAWSDHRLFLLHHAANALLLVMGVLLALRLVRSLNAVEEANRTLEARVQQREREIAASYERIATLQRERAAADERQRIMRDLHDGLGSQLFTSLSRVERGAMDSGAMADSLRGAIDQMRVAIEALASEEQDFQAAFGNFRFRWDTRLRDAGIVPTWEVELPENGVDGTSTIEPHATLQLLHIIQEALTNVVRHAQAATVTVRLLVRDGTLAVDIEDDGRGDQAPAAAVAPASPPIRPGGRGRANMRSRAQRLGGQIEWLALSRGMRVSLRAPWHLAAAGSANA